MTVKTAETKMISNANKVEKPWLPCNLSFNHSSPSDSLFGGDVPLRTGLRLNRKLKSDQNKIYLK